MQASRVPGFIRTVVTMTAFTAVLSGCLMGEEKAKSDEEVAQENRLTGSVGDGPIAGASLKLRRNDGALVAEFLSDANASYDVTIQEKGKNYPLTIESVGGTDLVTNTAPDFNMKSVVLQPGNRSIANVNPFSTIALEMALEMPGGISKENIDLAESIVTAELGSGLSTLIAAGPIHGSIDSINIAEIVKASESLAEIIRRTRDLHLMHSRPSSGNQVLRALASDLTDAMLDGRGMSRTEPRTSAIASVVSVLVYLESMQNELYVNGVDAMMAMDDAITQVTDATATRMVEDITVTADMIHDVRLGLSACLVVESNPKLVQLNSAFAGVQPGMDAVLIRSLLPADYRQTMQTTVQNIAAADDTVIDTINSVVRAGIDEPNINQAPSISGTPVTSVIAGSAYSFTPSAADPEGDALTFSINNRPAWATFNSASGRLSGIPGSADVRNYSNIIISVSDGEFTASLPAFAINVAALNAAPTISGTPATQVVANSSYAFTPTASDPNGDTLTFSVTGRPSWASFNTSTGRLSGTPAVANVGSYSGIVISVSDAEFTRSLPAFTITVSQPPVTNRAPTISGTPATQVVANSSYTFTPTASDPDGDTLTFSIVGRPSWASFNTSTGRLSGTPAIANVGSYNGITISVSDAQLTRSLPTFTITVSQPPVNNRAPTISGTPATQVNANSAYAFTPTASDPDGNTLTFSVTGLPVWASFSTSTGRISGTPTAAHVGTYSNIRITVSDGSLSASLAAFTIAVNAISLGSVTLNWTPPTQNEDGTPLTNLAGYRFYWGTTPGNYSNSVTLNNPGLSSYVVDNLAPGTYEFVATSFNSTGVESVYSNPATKVVP